MSKIAFIYPGQGAQKCGMGKDFYENSKLAKDVYDNASEALGIDMKELCFEENERINQTEYTQIAMVTTCLAMTEVIKESGLKPDVTAGLSLGEYCAIATAGGMSTMQAIKTVRKRGLFMEAAAVETKGAMAAVLGMTGAQIEEVIKDIDGVSIANYNCPGQIVITGVKEKVEEANALLAQNGAKRTQMLNVSGAFHSALIKEAGDNLYEELKNIDLGTLQIPYVTNVTAEYVNDTKNTKELLREQVSSSVRWQQSIENMIENGVDTFVEIGPGKTLSGFMKRINPNVKAFNINTWDDVKKVVNELC
ncbi:MAG: ACP S-malonyltransferase [Lachnospiraceae bacterium]|nr:ACP S-malonyltransferase [Lachnospiraceae bacterium]